MYSINYINIFCLSFLKFSIIPVQCIFLFTINSYVKIGQMQSIHIIQIRHIYILRIHEFDSTRIERKDQVGEQPSELPVPDWRR